MVSFINGLDSTLAIVLLCALLFVDEAGLPLPLAPNELLLLVGGLLIGTGTLSPFVYLPLALVAMTAGMLSGFGWARLLGSTQLSSLARRLHAEKTYEKAAARLRSAGPVQIGVTRVLPGVRTYATLVAGGAGVDLRRFLSGALPALVVWLSVLTALGALVGLPAEHVIGQVDGLAVSGVLLLALGLGAFLAVSRIPRAEREEHPLAGLPGAVRLPLALGLDAGILVTLIAGVERLIARVVNPGHPFGRLNDAILVTTIGLVGYVVASRRIAGATLGEGLFSADYRTAAHRLVRRLRRRDRPAPHDAEVGGRSAGAPEPAAVGIADGAPSRGQRGA